MVDTCGSQRRRPLAVTEPFEVDVATARSGEEDLGFDPPGHRVERIEHALTEGHRAEAPVGLAALFQLAACRAANFYRCAAPMAGLEYGSGSKTRQRRPRHAGT